MLDKRSIQLAELRDTIQTTRLLLQAKAHRKDGKTHVVTVYEMSNEQFFFFSYTAKTARTPRRLWKLVNFHIIHEGRKYDPLGANKLATFEHFLNSQRLQIADGAKWKVRYPHNKKPLLAHIQRVSIPDYIPQEKPAGATYGVASARSAGKTPSKADWRKYNELAKGIQ